MTAACCLAWSFLSFSFNGLYSKSHSLHIVKPGSAAVDKFNVVCTVAFRNRRFASCLTLKPPSAGVPFGGTLGLRRPDFGSCNTSECANPTVVAASMSSSSIGLFSFCPSSSSRSLSELIRVVSLLFVFIGLGNDGGEDGGDDGTISVRVASEGTCDSGPELEVGAGTGLKKASIDPRLTLCALVWTGSFGS